MASSDIVLTWDVNTKRGDKRRAQACGSQYCTASQTLLRQTTGDKTIEISCDEFPFASSEEGGNYYQTLPVNPTAPQLTCVPAWQNTLQGNCNSKSGSSTRGYRASLIQDILEILSNLYTNIAHYKPGGGDNFVQWNSDGWTSLGNVFNDAATPQRLAAYPNQVPQTVGVPDNVSALSPFRSYQPGFPSVSSADDPFFKSQATENFARIGTVPTNKSG